LNYRDYAIGENVMSDIKDMRSKIQALLTKANDTSVTEAEADAFNRKAHELMLKYNIQRAELGDQEGPVERMHMTLEVQLRPWSQAVLAGITQLYFCRYFSQKQDAKGRSHKITLIGEKQNVMICHAIAVMVLRSIQMEARASGDGRSFMTGAGHRVMERCNEMTDYTRKAMKLEQTKQIAGGSHNALVPLEQKEQQGNSDYISSVLNIQLRMRAASRPRVNSGEGYHRGREHGGKVQLRRNLLA
jgi:hypothetical protein